jgi:hypothetical protein
MKGVCIGFVVFLSVLCCISTSSATIYNVTTEGQGYLLLSSPDTVIVNEPFPVRIDYYFLNQLVRTTNVSLGREGNVFATAFWNVSDENTTLAVTHSEPQKASFTYLLTITETFETGRIAVTEVPFSVQVNTREIEFTNTTLYLGIVYNASDTAFEDLSLFEPAPLKGLFMYTVGSKNAGQVDCQVQDSLVIFLPNQRHMGPAECMIKGTYQNTTVRYTFKLFVGTPSDVKAFERDHERVVQDKPGLKKDAIQPALLAVASTENEIETNVVGIKLWAVPDNIVEGMNGKIILEINVRDPALVDNINVIGFLTENNNVTNTTCNGTTCRVEYERTFPKAGLQRLFVFTNIIMKRNTSVPASLGNGWTALASGQSDIFISSSNAFVHIKARLPDISIPQVGIIQDTSQPDSAKAAEGLLREYQKESRQPLQMTDELKNINKIAQQLVVIRTYTPVVVTDETGERVMHTIINMNVSKKQTPWYEYLIGIRRLEKILIIEHIPKESAGDLGHVRFTTQGYSVVNDDPIVAWTIERLEGSSSFIYEVDRRTELPGNTLIRGQIKRGFPYGVFLLLIPIIIILLVQLRKYRERLAEEAHELSDHPPSYAEIKQDYVLPEEKFTSDVKATEEVKPESITNLGDFDKLIDSVEDYIAQRLARGDPHDYIKGDLVKANWPGDVVEKLIEKQKKILKEKKEQHS